MGGRLITYQQDPIFGLQATKPKDFVDFINLVDFCRLADESSLISINSPSLFRYYAYYS